MRDRGRPLPVSVRELIREQRCGPQGFETIPGALFGPRRGEDIHEASAVVPRILDALASHGGSSSTRHLVCSAVNLNSGAVASRLTRTFGRAEMRKCVCAITSVLTAASYAPEASKAILLFADRQEITMITRTRPSAQGRAHVEADKLDGSRNSSCVGPGATESDSEFRDFAVMCAWATVGIILTVATAIWFGLEIQ
jgi:hypothetical protein